MVASDDARAGTSNSLFKCVVLVGFKYNYSPFTILLAMASGWSYDDTKGNITRGQEDTQKKLDSVQRNNSMAC